MYITKRVCLLSPCQSTRVIITKPTTGVQHSAAHASTFFHCQLSSLRRDQLRFICDIMHNECCRCLFSKHNTANLPVNSPQIETSNHQSFVLLLIPMQSAFVHAVTGGSGSVKWPKIFSQVSNSTQSQIFVLSLWGCLVSCLFFPSSFKWKLSNKASVLNVLFISRFGSFWEGKKNIWEWEQNGTFNTTQALFFWQYKFSREKEKKGSRRTWLTSAEYLLAASTCLCGMIRAAPNPNFKHFL